MTDKKTRPKYTEQKHQYYLEHKIQFIERALKSKRKLKQKKPGLFYHEYQTALI